LNCVFSVLKWNRYIFKIW